MRLWLVEHLRYLDDAGAGQAFILALRSNRDILDDHLERYGATVVESGPLRVLREELGIPRSSWLFREILRSQVGYACTQDDATFLAAIPVLLEGLNEHPTILDQGIGQLLHRYAATTLASTPHLVLQSIAVSDGQSTRSCKSPGCVAHVPEPTRRCVEGWVKRRVIEMFFDIISSRYSSDRRRPDYWLRYADEIDELHLFLGDDAFHSHLEAYKELRLLMQGNYTYLEQPASSRENNGFMMVIGGLAFVEFSERVMRASSTTGPISHSIPSGGPR